MKFWGLGSEDEVRLVMFRFSQLKLKSCLTKFTSGVLTITCMSDRLDMCKMWGEFFFILTTLGG